MRPASGSDRPLIILGVDPGTKVTGYALIQESGERPSLLASGAIVPERGALHPQRLLHIHDALAGLLAQWKPSEVALEDFVFGHRQAAVAVGEARAVAVLAAARAGLPVFIYKPAEVKKAVAGYGRGSKEQIQEMVRLHLGLAHAPAPADAADAVAVAICHLFHRLSRLS